MGKEMNKILLTVLVMFIVTGCKTTNSNNIEAKSESSQKAVESKVAVAMSSVGEISLQSITPYKEGADIASNIKEECKLNKQLPGFIASFSAANGTKVSLRDTVTKATEGKSLVVEIVEAVSRGNAFIGHRKYTKVKGTLYDSGTKKAGFTAARISGGGFFGGYKGSCSVLGRTVKTIGKDISAWLKNPVDGAYLGDHL
jgi:hypothetical protein